MIVVDFSRYASVFVQRMYDILIAICAGIPLDLAHGQRGSPEIAGIHTWYVAIAHLWDNPVDITPLPVSLKRYSTFDRPTTNGQALSFFEELVNIVAFAVRFPKLKCYLPSRSRFSTLCMEIERTMHCAHLWRPFLLSLTASNNVFRSGLCARSLRMHAR